MTPVARRLLAARFWRSISQGTLVVDLALYLHALGWPGAAIGGVLSAGGVAGAALNLVVGVTSDRLRRKPFLLAYEGLSCLCAVAAIASTAPLLLGTAIVLAGFGRGANGAAGPFAPAEQAWLAEAVPAPDRGFVYSINTAFGFVGMTIGALAAALPPLWAGVLGHAASFRPLFAIVLVGNAVNIVLLSATPELHRPAGRRHAAASAAAAGGRSRENRFLRRLAALNALNGLAVGLTGPLIAYWFALRFHVGADIIGPIMAVTFAVTAVSAVVMARLTRRVGMVKTVVWGRSGGVVLLALLPLMPAYTLAALLYVARSALNRGSVGARQALVMSLVEDARRGFAASVNALSMQVPRSVGPAVAGAMIGGGMFAAPFFMAAGLQALYVVFYGRLFAPLEREAGGNGGRSPAA